MNRLANRRSIQSFFTRVTLLACIAGCTSIPSPTATLMPINAKPMFSTVQSGQAMPIPTNTPRPVELPSSTMPASSPTPTLVPTLTPLPTLTGEQALAFVAHMQETNGNCELPCWWGITPGETTGLTARQILSPLREQMKFFIEYLGGSEARYELQLKEYNHIRIELIMRDEVQPIDEIWVFSSIPDEDKSTLYYESWRQYYVSELFARLGEPSDVWLGFGLHTGDHDERPLEKIPYFYELYVFYSDLGLIVRYAGPAIDGNPSRACLSFEQLREMLMFIRQRSKGPLVGPPWEPFTNARPISEVTHLSVEAFYEMVKNAKEPVCIESP
jgi:hypothetical protein